MAITKEKKKVILKGNCKSCAATKDPVVAERFYKAWFEREPDGETLKDIGRELDISQQAIYRHANLHMQKRVNKQAEMVIKDEAARKLKLEAMKELELSFDHDRAVPKQDYERVIDQILLDGLAQIKTESTKFTVNQLIAAAKIKGDWQAKKRGQDAEIIKMMYRSASGFNGSSTGSRNPTATQS